MIRSSHPMKDVVDILTKVFSEELTTFAVTFDLKPRETYQVGTKPFFVFHSPSYAGANKSLNNVFRSNLRGGPYDIEFSFLVISNTRIDKATSVDYRGSILNAIDTIIERFDPVQEPGYWDYQQITITIGETTYTNKTARELGITSIKLTEGPTPDQSDGFDVFVYSGKFLVTLLRLEDKLT